MKHGIGAVVNTLDGALGKEFNVGDAVIWYEVLKREPGAPTIVYLHGNSTNHTAFNHQRSHFHKMGSASLAPDQRGDGKSTLLPSKSAYTLEAHVSDLEKLVEAEGIKRATIVGHSKGAMVAQAYAAKHSDAVDAIVLIAGSYNFEESFKRSPLRKVLFELAPYMDTSRIYNMVAGLFVHNRENYYADFSSEKFRRISDLGFVLEIFGKSTTEYVKVMQVVGAAVLNWDTKESVAGINTPTLIINGEMDQLVPPKTAFELQEMIPGAKHFEPVIIPGARHGVHFQAPEQVTAAMEKFLAGEIYSGRLMHKV